MVVGFWLHCCHLSPHCPKAVSPLLLLLAARNVGRDDERGVLRVMVCVEGCWDERAGAQDERASLRDRGLVMEIRERASVVKEHQQQEEHTAQGGAWPWPPGRHALAVETGRAQQEWEAVPSILGCRMRWRPQNTLCVTRAIQQLIIRSRRRQIPFVPPLLPPLFRTRSSRRRRRLNKKLLLLTAAAQLNPAPPPSSALMLARHG